MRQFYCRSTKAGIMQKMCGIVQDSLFLSCDVKTDNETLAITDIESKDPLAI